MNTKINVQNAFNALFESDHLSVKTPWERSNMSYAEWHKMYVKACDEASELRRQCENGKFIDEEV